MTKGVAIARHTGSHTFWLYRQISSGTSIRYLGVAVENVGGDFGWNHGDYLNGCGSMIAGYLGLDGGWSSELKVCT